MLRIYLLLLALSVSGSTIAQSEKNYSNLKYLIKDTTILAQALDGKYPHPAVEIAVKREFSSTQIKNYPIRISIDPGHVATSKKEALIEERYINSQFGFFYESELNMATAILLKEMLVQRGFDVMLTRNENESVLGRPFLKWYKKDFKERLENDRITGKISNEKYTDLINASPKDVFNKYYKDLDFIERANKINAFNPDITIAIHYNATEFKNDIESYAPTTTNNYSVTFVPGGFTFLELTNNNQMDDFIRLATTDNLEKSILLSGFIVKEFEDKFQAQRLTPEINHDLWYLKKYSVYTNEPGVFSRNLYLTRAIKSPICYGECFLQNNIKEIEKLAQRTLRVGKSLNTSPRVKDVADAYYAGIMKYFKHIEVLGD